MDKDVKPGRPGEDWGEKEGEREEKEEKAGEGLLEVVFLEDFLDLGGGKGVAKTEEEEGPGGEK